MAKDFAARILLLDDNAMVRELCTARLEAAGYETKAISGPFELAPALKTYRPHAALIDVSMPAIQGDKLVEFVRHSAANPASVCLLVLYSDMKEADLRELAARSKADAFVSKADGLDHLLFRLEQLSPLFDREADS